MTQADLQALLRSRAEVNEFRRRIRAIINDPMPPAQTVQKNNKVDAIGKFLTKLRKASNYNQALIDDIAKYNLKNFRDDLGNAVIESLTGKFDMSLVVKVGVSHQALAQVWVSYADDEFRAGLFIAFDKFLADRK